MTSKITYLGELRTSAIHIQSGTEILSDAPVDNHGKGEAFSPTDMLATSLGSCMMTIMAIKARDLQVDLTGSTVGITKVMQTEPRRIGLIGIQMKMKGTASAKEKTILERVAMNCPVYLSLHPDVKKEISFDWE